MNSNSINIKAVIIHITNNNEFRSELGKISTHGRMTTFGLPSFFCPISALQKEAHQQKNPFISIEPSKKIKGATRNTSHAFCTLVSTIEIQARYMHHNQLARSIVHVGKSRSLTS
jgi:hypothetical protein